MSTINSSNYDIYHRERLNLSNKIMTTLNLKNNSSRNNIEKAVSIIRLFRNPEYYELKYKFLDLYHNKSNNATSSKKPKQFLEKIIRIMSINRRRLLSLV